MKAIAYLLSVILSICLIGGIFWGCMESVALDEGYYAQEYERLHRMEASGLSREDIDRATQTLLQYVRAEREDIDLQAEVFGRQTEVFSEREKTHMADVRQLYTAGSVVRTLLWVTAAACLLMLLLVSRRSAGRLFSRAFLLTLLGVGTVVALLGVTAAMDFERFWSTFHQTFFSNDLWLLDPATDVMIRMFPSSFFLGMIQAVLMRFGTVLGILGIAAVAVLTFGRRSRKREALS